MDEDDAPVRPKRDWPELREWANFAVAGAALFVSVVSLWTTAQISGLEDYFRSEIALRNSELGEAGREARALDERVQRSTAQLEELRARTDRLVVSSNEAQTRLAEAQNRSLGLISEQQRSSAALSASRAQLASVADDITAQKALLDGYRRDEVLAHARRTFGYLQFTDFWRNNGEVKTSIDGPYALNEMANFGMAVRDPDKEEYYKAIRTIGPAICRGLSSFSPTFPLDLERPKLEPLKGESTDRGTVRTTNKELKAYDARVAVWSAEWDRVSKYNESIRAARAAANDYVRDALWHCSCAAIKGASLCEPMPERPDIAAMIAPRP